MVSKLSPVKRCGSQRESSILPARVRACAEIAGKTTSRPRGRTRERSQCSSAMGCSDEASQRYCGGGRVGLTDVRESRHCSKHEALPYEPPADVDADIVGGLIGCVALSPGENGSVTVPVKSHGVLARRQVKPTYKSYGEREGLRAGEGKAASAAPSLGIAADPEYAQKGRKEKPQRAEYDSWSHEDS